METKENIQNGPEMAQSKRSGELRHAKSHQDYWKDRLLKRSYHTRDGRVAEMPEWHVRIAQAGRRNWFNLETPNKNLAALKAREIYLSLVANGWAATLQKFKPGPPETNHACTVGEFLSDVRQRSHLKQGTVRRYAVKLRKMVADIAELEARLPGKGKQSKYDYVNGGRQAWIDLVDAQYLAVLNPESVNEWRNRYVARAGPNPVARKSAERSAASYIRCARALFSPDVLRVLKVKSPPSPFDGVKLKDPGPQRYHSEVNPELLLVAAERDLRAGKPQLYLGLVLCLWAGLRRKEADLLTWEQVDLKEGQIHVRRTEFFEPKTEESQRVIDLSPEAVQTLREFKAREDSEFVMRGNSPHPDATYDYYRCDRTWRNLNAWLREKGVRQTKAIHALRKESGSLVASAYGIEAARQHLGHRDIRTTSSHYVDKKRRIEVSVRALDNRLNEQSA